MRLSDFATGTLEALRSASGVVPGLGPPALRLGVTGLARSGKTVFITALVHNLIAGGRLPFFRASAQGRLLGAWLEPQPDDAVPRFDYEANVAALVSDPPRWPESTRRIGELRIVMEYLAAGTLRRALGPRRLAVDIVDYPGEWLLDLALLDQSYEEWSREAITRAHDPVRARVSSPWLAKLSELDPDAPQDEQAAMAAARVFTSYLAAARAAQPVFSTLGPGRFLLPGDLAGSPLLAFAPLAMPSPARPRRGSLAAMMARRYESYKAHVVKPFFSDHFSRLDRQIVLVDALSAIDAGEAAVGDLCRALEASLRAFRPGARSWLGSIFRRRIDRVLFAATKADHLPSSAHDRLEAALRLMVERSAERVARAGAETAVIALAALRATREVEVREAGERLSCVRGVPLAGELVAGKRFDGRTEAAIFPGDLPADPRRLLAAGDGSGRPDVSFPRFRPPPLGGTGSEASPWPHIRLDRALEILIGDHLL